MKDINYLEGYCEGLAFSSEEKAFEVMHMKRVVKHANRLAIQRGLNLSVATFIAYAHDIGRLKLSVRGKLHAKVGAQYVKKAIQSFDLSELEKKTIVRAIKRHSNKNQIQGAYDELIKDADSLAHLEDFGIEHLSVYERQRILASDVNAIECGVSESGRWKETLSNQMRGLQLQWQIEAFDENPNRWVHSVRIEIRKTRSLIDMLNAACPSAELSAYSLNLKRIFNGLSEARMLYVMNAYQNVHKRFKDKKSLHTKLIKALNQVRCLIETTNPETLVFFGLNEMSVDVRDEVVKAFASYFNACNGSAFGIEQLHRLRVKGKLFKYACEHELVVFNTPSIVNGINDLHDAIGTAHDLHEMLRFKHAKRYFSTDQLKRDYKKALSRCEMHLFYFKLLSREQKGDA